MTWALKRQIFYVLILISFFGIFGFLIIYPSFNEAPTCADGRQNGTETGVDCGGSCLRACFFEADKASIIWTRSFLVVPGRYNAVAYLENHNKSLAVSKIKYQFRFADEDNVYLGSRKGIAFIPPGRNFAIFEHGIELSNSTPVYTTFSFTEVPNWISVPEIKINQLKLLVTDINLRNEKISPSLSATLKNDSLFSIPDVSIVVILYDSEHNAIAVSSTFLDQLSKEEEKIINFTWPMPILGQVITKEILPTYDIFRVKLK